MRCMNTLKHVAKKIELKNLNMKNFFVNPPIFFLIMNIGELLYQCNAEAKLIFRKYEKINKKIIEANWSKTFNEVCLKVNFCKNH